MDINILLAWQNFRNGPGACLESFMLKMSFLGEMNTVLIFIALIYWCVSKNFGNYLLKGWIPGVGGSIVSSFIQMFYISFIFPWLIKHFERVREYRSGGADHGMV